jgi:hypothetical protein
MLTDRLSRFLKTDDEKTKEANDILSFLKDSPALTERAREREEKRLGRIREFLAQRDNISNERAETMRGLQVALSEAKSNEARAVEALGHAIRERLNAEQAQFGASFDYSHKLSQVEAELKKLAPAEIDEFIREMLKADDQARLQLDTEVRPGLASRLTGTVHTTIVNSNLDAVAIKRDYIKAAIHEAEGMKLQSMTQDEVVSRLTELKAKIPDSHRFEMVSRPLPDVSGLR